MIQLDFSLADAIDDLSPACYLMSPVFQNGKAHHLEPFTIAIGRQPRKHPPVALPPQKGTWLSMESFTAILNESPESIFGGKSENT